MHNNVHAASGKSCYCGHIFPSYTHTLVPQLLGHSRTISRCPAWPSHTLCLSSILCVRPSNYGDIQTHNVQGKLDLHVHTVYSDTCVRVGPTCPAHSVSEHPHSYLDTPQLSLDVQLATDALCVHPGIVWECFSNWDAQHGVCVGTKLDIQG